MDYIKRRVITAMLTPCSQKRMQLFLEIIDGISLSCKLMNKYEAIPHNFNDKPLYQAESHMIQLIGSNQGITITELSALTGNTPSACSQVIRKLRKKNWVEQTRNDQNNREYNLSLTQEGWTVYQAHEAFDEICYTINCANLTEFEDDEIRLFLRMLSKINHCFKADVERSRGLNGDIAQVLENNPDIIDILMK